MADCEAMAAVAAFPDAHKVLRGNEANILSFEWAAPDADVLHLACHGLADLANPLDSGLLLAGGTVTLRDLLARRLRLRLAVLSACETALPGTDLPDEVVALPSGLLQAGVAGVVASQWAVPDRATAMLMAAFYRGWRQDGLVPVAALRSAQRWLRDTTNAEKTEYFQELSGWLAPEAVERFVARLGPPEERGHDGMHSWAAFAYVGA
jgi:CHAT domain-containing protein